MKMIVAIFSLIFLCSGAFGQSGVPQCKDQSGAILSGSLDQIKEIMSSRVYRPQVYAVGVVSAVLPDDLQGLPHQKFAIKVGGLINLEIVSNLDFGRIPVQVGQSIAVCGEFLEVGQGMIHWTHFDPHGTHANGFTIVNGQIFGKFQTATTGESYR